MRPRLKLLIFVAIWFNVIAFAIGLVVWSAHSAPREVPRGSGAKALLKGIKQVPVTLPTVPSIAPQQPKTYYYVVNCTDSAGFTSGNSTEVYSTNLPATLAWSPPACTNVITNYTLLRGTNSGTYLRSWPAGTNLTLRVPPASPTNVVLTISGVGYLLVLTNPTGFKTFKGTNMTISRRYQ
jgi:hypothetical protein